MIPRNIIQFWHDLSHVPKAIKGAMTTTKANNRNYKIISADDAYMQEFIKQHYSESALQLYNLNRIAASRSDIARLMLLYEYGGFYIDAAMELKKSLDEIHNDQDDLILVQRDDSPIYANCPQHAHCINGFIGAPRKSKFIRHCIDQIFINLLHGNFNKNVFSATGPQVINSTLTQLRTPHTKKLSFSSMQNNFFVYRRVTGLSNAWVCSQHAGIIPTDTYDKGMKQFQKTLFLKRIAFQFSFSFLRFR